MARVESIRRRGRRCALGIVTVLALPAWQGCSLGPAGTFPPSASARQASDVPARFEPLEPAARVAPGDTIGGSGCVSPMVDPRDGTPVRLVRSLGGLGDYEAPAARYGGGPTELLRLECNTGAVIGIVRQ